MSGAVFISYASQDAAAASRLAEALRAAGAEVWFDQNELVGGDAWDAKIRGQIASCALFVPVISANTQARLEGYFRLEWKLAAQRTHTMADEKVFLLPVVIDETRDADAKVPAEFKAVQWTRLSGGGGAERFSARVRRVLDGDEERRPATARPAEQSAGRAKPARSGGGWRERWWIIFPVLGMVTGLVFAVQFAWPGGGRRKADASLRPEAASAPGPLVPAAQQPAAASPQSGESEARHLVAKAYTLLRGLDATREDFALAEEYCQRALKLDPDDGEVWAAYSQVNAAFAYRGWDNSPTRKEQTRAMAERAIRLAPTSAEARIAQAGAWSTFGINRDERENLLREVVRDQPTNQGALRFLAVTVLPKPGGLEECLALNERSAALPGGDPLALFNNARYLWTRGRQAEGFAMLERSLEQKPFSSSLVLKMAMEISWRGDLAAAEATLRQIPPAALQEDRANYFAGLLRYYQRDAAAALEIWQAFPRDYFADFAFEGPKGLLLGLAYELDHREVAAKIEWRGAVQVGEKRIAAAPNNPAPYLSQAMLLACLGEKAAAGEALRTYEQLSGLKYTVEQPMNSGLARVYARLGRFDEIFALPPGGSAAIMRISPDFDLLRADPRFERWVGSVATDSPRVLPPGQPSLR